MCVSHDTAQDCPTTWQRSSHCAQSSVGCQKPIRLKDFSSSHDQQNLTREDEKVCRYCHKFKRHYRGWAIDFRERKSPRMEFHIVSITTWRSMWLSTLACMTGALWARRTRYLAFRARVALRAKYRVRPAWLIKRLSCRLINPHLKCFTFSICLELLFKCLILCGLKYLICLKFFV